MAAGERFGCYCKITHLAERGKLGLDKKLPGGKLYGTGAYLKIEIIKI